MDRSRLVVRPLADVSSPGVDALVRESLRERFRFLERLRAEHESGANRFAGEGEALLGAYEGGTLAGVGGLNRDPYSGLPGAARIRHLYVLPCSRRSGLGRALMAALVAHAKEHGFAELVLRTDTAAAARFYETLGFARVADVHGATHRLTIHRHPERSIETMANSPLPGRAIVSERVFDASPEEIFRAFGDPARLAEWWGPAGFTNRFEEFDFRAGGAWRFVMHGPDGAEYRLVKEFVEVAAPERLVIRQVDASHGFTLTITLAGEGGRTRMSWSMLFDDPEEGERVREFIAGANEQNFDRLAAHLTAGG